MEPGISPCDGLNWDHGGFLDNHPHQSHTHDHALAAPYVQSVSWYQDGSATPVQPYQPVVRPWMSFTDREEGWCVSLV